MKDNTTLHSPQLPLRACSDTYLHAEHEILDSTGRKVAKIVCHNPKLEAQAQWRMRFATARQFAIAVNNHEALKDALADLMRCYVGDRTAQNCFGESGIVADRARELLRSLEVVETIPA